MWTCNANTVNLRRRLETSRSYRMISTCPRLRRFLRSLLRDDVVVLPNGRFFVRGRVRPALSINFNFQIDLNNLFLVHYKKLHFNNFKILQLMNNKWQEKISLLVLHKFLKQNTDLQEHRLVNYYN
jgi:hypothetical protein